MFFLSVESDLRFRFISVNQSFLDATGLSENQVAGKYVDEVIPEPSLTLVLENYKQAIQENKTVRWFEVTPYPSGTKYGHVAITPVYDRNGRCTNLIGSVHDITEIKQIEEALRVSKEKYTKVFLSAPDAITISELESGRFMEVNDAASKIWGYSRDELIGRSALELGIWPKKEIRDAFIDQVSTNGRVEQYEVMERRKSGDLFNASATANTITIGNIRYLIAITRDISDLKRAEEQLKHFNEDLEKGIADRTEKLKASLEGRMLLLSEVHHRVKNNLQIILSLIRLQSRNIKDPHLLDTMGDFQNRIMAMAHVHERIYRAEDISRIDLSEIVTFLGTSLFKSYNVNPHHIRLNVEMKDLQISLNSAIPISLIINELISNSIKHAFPKGTTGEITIAGRREDNTLELSIKDTGIGIPKDLDWMINYQSLGHRLVVGLVQQLNGTIELDRTTGTTFNIVVKEKQ